MLSTLRSELPKHVFSSQFTRLWYCKCSTGWCYSVWLYSRFLINQVLRDRKKIPENVQIQDFEMNSSNNKKGRYRQNDGIRFEGQIHWNCLLLYGNPLTFSNRVLYLGLGLLTYLYYSKLGTAKHIYRCTISNSPLQGPCIAQHLRVQGILHTLLQL